MSPIGRPYHGQKPTTISFITHKPLITLMKKAIDAMKPGIVQILRKHDVSRAGLFGSYARGEEKKGSDIDLLVEIEKDISLFDFAGIKVELEEKFRKNFDLVEYGAIKPALKNRILGEEIRLM